MKSASIAVLLLGIAGFAFSAEPRGNATAGAESFAKFRCNTCHSVYGQQPAAQVPLRDLSKETPEAVKNLILARTHLAPEALFDEMAMSATASQMTERELADIVAYLRKPR